MDRSKAQTEAHSTPAFFPRRPPMAPDPSDRELAQRAAQGDHAAFTELCSRARPRLQKLVMGLLWDADETDSAVQEAFTRAWEQHAEFHVDAPFTPWVAAIAVNIARNLLRNRARRSQVTDPAQFDLVAQAEGRRRGVLSGILKQELHEQLYRELPLPLREVLVLHDLQQLDYPEIARLTGVAEGTLRVRAHRARALLKESLGSLAETWLQALPKPR